MTTASPAAAKMAAFAARTRSRPLPEPDELPLPPAPPAAPAPAPRPTPAPSPDPVAAVVRAFVAGPDPTKTVSEIIAATGMRRGDIVSIIAGLAAEERLVRHIRSTKTAR